LGLGLGLGLRFGFGFEVWVWDLSFAPIAQALLRCDPAQKHFVPSLPPILFLGDSNAALYKTESGEVMARNVFALGRSAAEPAQSPGFEVWGLGTQPLAAGRSVLVDSSVRSSNPKPKPQTQTQTSNHMLTTPWAIAHILASKMRPLANALIKCYG
jgi:hypothetical protein